MKISIDTKEDSPEEIRKTINLLKSLIGENEKIYTNTGNIFDSPSSSLESSPESEPEPQPTNAFANMFGSGSPAPSLAESETPVLSNPLVETPETVDDEESDKKSAEQIIIYD